MNSKRMQFVLIGTICLLLIGMGSGAYSVNKALSKKADKLNLLKAKSLALGIEQQSLVKSKKDIKTYAQLNEIAKKIVPQDKDQAEAVRELTNIATANNITIDSIDFPASTLGSGVPTASSSALARPAPAAKSNAKKGLSQLLPVANIPGVYLLPITVKGSSIPVYQPGFSGAQLRAEAYEQLIQFLKDLEYNRRTSQVSTITISPYDASSALQFQITINEYVKP